MVKLLIFRDWKRPGKIKGEPFLLRDLVFLLCMGTSMWCLALLEMLNSFPWVAYGPTVTLGSWRISLWTIAWKTIFLLGDWKRPDYDFKAVCSKMLFQF